SPSLLSFVTIPCLFMPTASCLPHRAFYPRFIWNSWSDTNTVSSIKWTSCTSHGQLPQLGTIAQEARGEQWIEASGCKMCTGCEFAAAVSTFKEWHL
uniref:Uncharacterized protein n=1 Tax=Malurus cyaneus samueli TaxID=2593467 RepID=A0A8C5TNH2_9PASS